MCDPDPRAYMLGVFCLVDEGRGNVIRRDSAFPSCVDEEPVFARRTTFFLSVVASRVQGRRQTPRSQPKSPDRARRGPGDPEEGDARLEHERFWVRSELTAGGSPRNHTRSRRPIEGVHESEYLGLGTLRGLLGAPLKALKFELHSAARGAQKG